MGTNRTTSVSIRLREGAGGKRQRRVAGRGAVDHYALLHLAWAGAAIDARRRFLNEVLQASLADFPPRALNSRSGGGSRPSLPPMPGADDHLSRYLAERVTHSIEHRVQSSTLYRSYEAWCHAGAIGALSQSSFSRRMAERGYQRLHSNVTWWLDLKLESSP